MAEEKLVGVVTHYFGHISVGILKLTAGELKIGDKVHFKGHSTDFEQTIASMQVDHKDVAAAKKGEEFGTKVDQKVREDDEVFLVA